MSLHNNTKKTKKPGHSLAVAFDFALSAATTTSIRILNAQPVRLYVAEHPVVGVVVAEHPVVGVVVAEHPVVGVVVAEHPVVGVVVAEHPVVGVVVAEHPVVGVVVAEHPVVDALVAEHPVVGVVVAEHPVVGVVVDDVVGAFAEQPCATEAVVVVVIGVAVAVELDDIVRLRPLRRRLKKQPPLLLKRQPFSYCHFPCSCAPFFLGGPSISGETCITNDISAPLSFLGGF